MAAMQEMHVTVDNETYHFIVDEKTAKMLTEDHDNLLNYINKLRREKLNHSMSTVSEQSKPEETQTNVQNFKDNTREKTANEWTRQATLLLIDTRLQMEEEFLKPIQKSKLWHNISDEMKKSGYTFQLAECHAKWRNLMCTYRKNVDRSKESGSSSIKWEFFHKFHEVYGNRSNVNPPSNYLRSSLSCTSEKENFTSLPLQPENLNSPQEEPRKRTKKKKTSSEPPMWFKMYLDQKEIEDKKKAIIEDQRWNDLKKMEEEKLNSMKLLTVSY